MRIPTCGRVFWIFDVFQTLFINFNTTSRFYGLKMAADILARQDGRDTAVRRPRLLSQIHFSLFQIPLVAGKSKIDTFFKHSFCFMVLWETAWGKMSVMTEGSCQVFIKNVTLTRVLHVKVNISLTNSNFVFSV